MQRALTANPATPPHQQKTILVVDDTKANLIVIGELVQPTYRVRVANSGQRALKEAGIDPRPDLILLDVMMPERDGYEVLEQLLLCEETRDIPVIFVTAMDATHDEEGCLNLGVVDYVTKPIHPAILISRMPSSCCRTSSGRLRKSLSKNRH